MGVYFNPSNESFTKDRNYKIYMDKTGLLEYLNESIGTPKNCIALSHARRFGKSHAAGMIDAYYSRGCDSSKLFDDTKIAECADYRKYMNQYNVIHLDISSVWDFHKEDLVESIHERVCEDFQKEYADTLNYDKDLYLLIQEIYSRSRIPFVLIILILFCSMKCDWGIGAPVFTLLFIWSNNSILKKKIAFIIPTVLFGLYNFISCYGKLPIETCILNAVICMIGMGMSGICVIYFYNGKRTEIGRSFSKWFFYIFYPLHLLIFALIRILA